MASDIKDLIRSQLALARKTVLGGVKDGVGETQFAVGGTESTDWDRFFCAVGLIGGTANALGTFVAVVPGAGVPGAIFGGAGGILAVVAGVEQNFNKPNFVPQQDIVDGVIQSIKGALNNMIEATDTYIEDVLEPLVEKTLSELTSAKAKKPGQPPPDRRTILLHIYRTQFKGLAGGLGEHSIEPGQNGVFETSRQRTKAALQALFPLVVDFYRLQQQQVHLNTFKDSSEGSRAAAAIMGVSMPAEVPSVDTKKAAEIRARYLGPGNFLQHFREWSRYQIWKTAYGMVPIPGV